MLAQLPAVVTMEHDDGVTRDGPRVAALLQELVSLPGFLEPEARVVFETPRATWRDEGDLPWLDVLLRRRYGSTALFVTRPRVEPSP